MMRATCLVGVLAFGVAGGCASDESLTAYGAAGRAWVLQSIDGAGFPARATMEFPEPGRIVGRAPCNRYFGDQRAVYPWFEVGGVASTRMACPDLEAEGAFFTALEAMTLSEVRGDTLILSTPGGREMVFTAAQDE